MLRVTDICKTFTTRKPHKEVLRNVSFEVEQRRFVSLLGPSGCGKTTLLPLLGGFQKPDAGLMTLNGRPITRPGSDRGFVFQDYALFPWLTVKQNVQFPMKERGLSKQEREASSAELFAMTRLNGVENLHPDKLSGGMKQRVAFIRALAGGPQLLLLDEPLGAVDPQMRKTLQVELENLWLQDMTTVLMVTHDIDESVYLSDRVLIMAPCDAPAVRPAHGNLLMGIPVELPRPRSRTDPARAELYRLCESKGVGITVMKALGAANSFPLSIRQHYKELSAHGSDCIECGGCEERCSFEVYVTENIRKAAAVFGS